MEKNHLVDSGVVFVNTNGNNDDSEREKKPGNTRCFSCQEMGHHSNECPIRRQNDRSGTSNVNNNNSNDNDNDKMTTAQAKETMVATKKNRASVAMSTALMEESQDSF